MTTAVIRERLRDYIDVADENKVKAIYTLLEDDIAAKHHWSDDEEFMAELNERVKRYEAGIEPGFSIDEAKSTLNEMKAGYIKQHKK